MNYITPVEFFQRNIHFFCVQTRGQYTPGPNDTLLKKSIDKLSMRFGEVSIEHWNERSLKQALDSAVDEMSKDWTKDQEQDTNGTKDCRNEVQHFLRWALMGGLPGPVLMLSMCLLGRSVSLCRIADATAAFKSGMS